MFIRDIPGGLTAKSPAKLNLYLEVSEPRPDGFHDIDSLFQTNQHEHLRMWRRRPPPLPQTVLTAIYAYTLSLIRTKFQ